MSTLRRSKSATPATAKPAAGESLAQQHKKLQKRLAYQFNDIELLTTALTHRSAAANNNERLEFLGDAVLSCVIAEQIYLRFPNIPEGDMSRVRARLVRGDTLGELGAELALGDAILLGPGELRSGGHRRKSILADAVEAILGAVYLDSGFPAAKALILQLFESRLDNLPPLDALKDPKTRLQEYLQAEQRDLPIYSITQIHGKDHQQMFTVRCEVADIAIECQGASRRKAEQAAAELMLKKLRAKAES